MTAFRIPCETVIFFSSFHHILIFYPSVIFFLILIYNIFCFTQCFNLFWLSTSILTFIFWVHFLGHNSPLVLYTFAHIPRRSNQPAGISHPCTARDDFPRPHTEIYRYTLSPSHSGTFFPLSFLLFASVSATAKDVRSTQRRRMVYGFLLYKYYKCLIFLIKKYLFIKFANKHCWQYKPVWPFL